LILIQIYIYIKMFYIKDTKKFEGKTPPEHYKFKYKPDNF